MLSKWQCCAWFSKRCRRSNPFRLQNIEKRVLAASENGVRILDVSHVKLIHIISKTVNCILVISFVWDMDLQQNLIIDGCFHYFKSIMKRPSIPTEHCMGAGPEALTSTVVSKSNILKVEITQSLEKFTVFPYLPQNVFEWGREEKSAQNFMARLLQLRESLDEW